MQREFFWKDFPASKNLSSMDDDFSFNSSWITFCPWVYQIVFELHVSLYHPQCPVVRSSTMKLAKCCVKKYSFSCLSCSSLYFTQSRCRDKDCTGFYKMWLQTKFGRDVFSVFFSFLFPKVPSMEFAISVEHQPSCLQSYLSETHCLILSGDNPLKPRPFTNKVQG